MRSIRNGSVRVTKSGLGMGDKAGIAGIADGIKHIAHKAVPPDPFDRAARKPRPKGGIVKGRKLCQGWRSVLGRIAYIARGLRKLVPRAHRKAIVTAIDAVAHQGAQFGVHRAMMFNREV